WSLVIGLIAAGRLDKAADVQRQRLHLHFLGYPLPLVSRTVGVDLDAVALGVGQVDRLADEMVGRAVYGQTLLDRTLHPAGEICTLRKQEGRVEEPRVTRIVRLEGRVFFNRQQLLVASAKDEFIRIAGKFFQPQ